MSRRAKRKAAVSAGIAETYKRRSFLRYASRRLPWVERVDRKLGRLFVRNAPQRVITLPRGNAVFFERRMVLQINGSGE